MKNDEESHRKSFSDGKPGRPEEMRDQQRRQVRPQALGDESSPEKPVRGIKCVFDAADIARNDWDIHQPGLRYGQAKGFFKTGQKREIDRTEESRQLLSGQSAVDEKDVNVRSFGLSRFLGKV